MPPTLKTIVQKLTGHYGSPAAPLSDPFELIIWENIAYLVDDERRAAAFAALNREVGLRPVDIMAAPKAQLTEFTQPGGIHAELRAQRLKESAQIVLVEFGGDLSAALKLPLKKAMNALKKFPSIGEPGAEKICSLLEVIRFSRSIRMDYGFCCDSALVRKRRSYSASYKSGQEADS